jgi:Flp pilus assembly protein TadG
MRAIMFRMPQFLRRFNQDRRGVSAIEFALLAPLMLMLYIGCVEISEGVAADRKVTLTAGALANLASQVTSISSTDKDNILQASIAIMSPYDGTISAKVSCLKIAANGTTTVAWGFASTGTTARAKGDVVTIPADLRVPNSSLVWSEVSYLYIPVTGFAPGSSGYSFISTTGITLSDQMFMAPRITPPVYTPTGDSCS